ncbi:MAG: hypothetical protein RR986_06155 [Longicatena sp.]
MNTYKEIKDLVSVQLQGKKFKLLGCLLALSFFFIFVKEGMGLALSSDSTLYMVLSFVTSILNIIGNAIVIVMFLCNTRGCSIKKEDIFYLCKNSHYVILVGILLSMIQMFVAMLGIFTSIIPILFVFVLSTIYLFFILWNAVVAFGVYDGNHKISELILGSLKLMFANIKSIMMVSLIFILWYAIGQIGIPMIMNSLLGEAKTAGLIIATMMKASETNMINAFLLGGIHVLYYGVQFVLLVPMYASVAIIYERGKKTYMPNNHGVLIK